MNTYTDRQKASIEAIQVLFQTAPADELGPTDEPESQYRFGYNTALEDAVAAVEKSMTGFSEPDADHEFKNFHRLLCERFDYVHDDMDWKRDQVSLIEWIARRVSGEPEGGAGDMRGDFALVPLKPDDAMQAAGAQAVRMDTTVLNRIWTANAVFKAMVAAAPSQPAAPATAPAALTDGEAFIDVVFDGPPSHESGRFIEVEDPFGKSINAGDWIDRENGLWALRIYSTPNQYKVTETMVSEAVGAVRRVRDCDGDGDIQITVAWRGRPPKAGSLVYAAPTLRGIEAHAGATLTDEPQSFGIPLFEDMRRALEHVECVYRLNFVAEDESSSTLANLQRVIARIHAAAPTPVADSGATLTDEQRRTLFDLYRCFIDALDRMDRARNILTDGNPRPDCNWGMLDTSDLRAALSATGGKS